MDAMRQIYLVKVFNFGSKTDPFLRGGIGANPSQTEEVSP